MRRPEPPEPPFRPAAHWEVRDAPHWRVLGRDEDFLCHARVVPKGSGWHCDRVAVAAVRNNTFWCARHMDDRWIEDGRVREWVLVSDNPARWARELQAKHALLTGVRGRSTNERDHEGRAVVESSGRSDPKE